MSDTPVEWFKWFTGTVDHVKVKRLARTLGSQCAGVFWLAKLWSLVAKYCPADGIFEGRIGREELEEELGWPGERGALVAALIHHRFLEASPSLRARAWREWQPGIMDARELGRRAHDRAVERNDIEEATARRQGRDREPRELPPSEYFLAWWSMVPNGKRAGIRPAYRAWRKNGLDDPGPAGVALREILCRVFGSQLANDTWRRDFDTKGTALSWMRKRDWEAAAAATAVKPPTPATVLPFMKAGPRDETDLRRDWAALVGNGVREWPGYDQAMREMMEHGKARN